MGSTVDECEIKKVLQLDHLTEKKRLDKRGKSRQSGEASTLGGAPGKNKRSSQNLLEQWQRLSARIST